MSLIREQYLCPSLRKEDSYPVREGWCVHIYQEFEMEMSRRRWRKVHGVHWASQGQGIPSFLILGLEGFALAWDLSDNKIV